MSDLAVQEGPPESRWRGLWHRVRRPLLAVLLLGVLCFIAWRARTLDWAAAWQALRDYPAGTLALAALLALAAHACYASYDLLARHYSGHRLPTARVAATAFVSFAANLNLGSMVGGVALRLRLYTRQGLPLTTVVRVWGLSLLTNWVGYAALAGAVFLSGRVVLPPDAPLGATALRVAGCVLWGVVGVYLAACRWSPRRQWTLRGAHLELPRARLALAQVALSALHWAVLAGVLYVLLQGRSSYATVLGTLMMSSMAVIAMRIPAGLGVLEAVFMTLLAGSQSPAQLLAALLAYRGLFYLAPLAAAVPVYFWLEARSRRRPQAGTGTTPMAQAARQPPGR